MFTGNHGAKAAIAPLWRWHGAGNGLLRNVTLNINNAPSGASEVTAPSNITVASLSGLPQVRMTSTPPPQGVTFTIPSTLPARYPQQSTPNSWFVPFRARATRAYIQGISGAPQIIPVTLVASNSAGAQPLVFNVVIHGLNTTPPPGGGGPNPGTGTLPVFGGNRPPPIRLNHRQNTAFSSRWAPIVFPNNAPRLSMDSISPIETRNLRLTMRMLGARSTLPPSLPGSP